MAQIGAIQKTLETCPSVSLDRLEGKLCKEFEGNWPESLTRSKFQYQMKNLPWWDADSFCPTTLWKEFHPHDSPERPGLGSIDIAVMVELIEELSNEAIPDTPSRGIPAEIAWPSDDSDEESSICYPALMPPPPDTSIQTVSCLP